MTVVRDGRVKHYVTHQTTIIAKTSIQVVANAINKRKYTQI